MIKNNHFLANYQGRQCSIRIKDHAINRIRERSITLQELDQTITYVSSLLLFLAKPDLKVNIVNERTSRTISLGVEIHKDGYMTLHIYTVIDERYRHPERNNLVIEKDGRVVMGGKWTRHTHNI